MSEDTDSEPEVEKERENYKVTESEEEDEDGTGGRQDEGDEEEEDEDYEEVVVKPRHLNEVTSLTDKTSPWTSILSDPDLVSLESLEVPEEPDLSQYEEEKKQTLKLQTHDCCGKHECGRGEESDDGSADDTSDTDRDDERTIQTADERPEKEAKSSSEGSDDEGTSLTAQHVTDTHDASCSQENQDATLQPYPWSLFLVFSCICLSYVLMKSTSGQRFMTKPAEWASSEGAATCSCKNPLKENLKSPEKKGC